MSIVNDLGQTLTTEQLDSCLDRILDLLRTGDQVCIYGNDSIRPQNFKWLNCLCLCTSSPFRSGSWTTTNSVAKMPSRKRPLTLETGTWMSRRRRR